MRNGPKRKRLARLQSCWFALAGRDEQEAEAKTSMNKNPTTPRSPKWKGLSREFWLAVLATITGAGALLYYRLPNRVPKPPAAVPRDTGGRPVVQGSDGNGRAGGEDTEGIGQRPFRDRP